MLTKFHRQKSPIVNIVAMFEEQKSLLNQALLVNTANSQEQTEPI